MAASVSSSTSRGKTRIEHHVWTFTGEGEWWSRMVCLLSVGGKGKDFMSTSGLSICLSCVVFPDTLARSTSSR